MVKIYGSSDDLVCLDNSNYAVDEIGCYDVAGVWLFLEDDTVLFVHYTDGIAAAMIVAAINDVPEAYIAKFLEVFYSGFTTNEAEHYAVMLRDDLIRNNTSKTGTQYAKYAFYRTANRLNQYYKTATGQRVAKRINDGDFPYNIYDATGRIVKPEAKKAKKKA